MNELETYLVGILKQNINDMLDTLNYYPCNSDGEFSLKEFEKTIDTLVEMIIEEQPEMPFTFVKNYIGQQ